MTAASTARGHGAGEITLITEDEHVAYSPCAIPFVVEGRIKDFQDIVMHTPEFYRRRGGSTFSSRPRWTRWMRRPGR